MGGHDSSDATPESQPQHKVIIYVSNQTRQIDPVDIMVTVDKRVIAHQDFHFGDGHNWASFDLLLPEGTHQIIARSERGKAFLDVVFDVNRKRWLVLDYWGEGHFQLGFREKQVYFMSVDPAFDIPNSERLRAPNKPAPGNAGIASRLAIEHHWPGVPEPGR